MNLWFPIWFFFFNREPFFFFHMGNSPNFNIQKRQKRNCFCGSLGDTAEAHILLWSLPAQTSTTLALEISFKNIDYLNPEQLINDGIIFPFYRSVKWDLKRYGHMTGKGWWVRLGTLDSWFQTAQCSFHTMGMPPGWKRRDRGDGGSGVVLESSCEG